MPNYHPGTVQVRICRRISRAAPSDGDKATVIAARRKAPADMWSAHGSDDEEAAARPVACKLTEYVADAVTGVESEP